MATIKLKVIHFCEDEKQTKLNIAFFRKEFPELDIIETCNLKKEFIHAVNLHHPYFVLICLTGEEKKVFDLVDYFSEIEPQQIFIAPFNQTIIRRLIFREHKFIISPFTKQEFNIILDRLFLNKTNGVITDNALRIQHYNQQQQDVKIVISVPVANGYQNIDITTIIRLNSDNSYTDIYMEDKTKVTVCRPIGLFEELLGPYNFAKANRSDLINPKFIKKLLDTDGGQLILTDDTIIDVTDGCREEIKRISELFSINRI
jgi:two-component system LytT family response regulator